MQADLTPPTDLAAPTTPALPTGSTFALGLIIFSTARQALRRNAMRSLLTTLGIIIGVAAVIAMVSISQGANAAVQEQIARLGNNMLVILPGSTNRGGVQSGSGGATRLNVADAKAISEECPAVRHVAQTRRQLMQVVAGNQNWYAAVNGVAPAYQDVRAWPVTQGRFLTPLDEQRAAGVAVLGSTVVANLFGPGQDPIDQTIRINNVPLRVVGMLSSKGQSSQGNDQDDIVLIPFSTAERKVFGTKILGQVGAILVSATSPEVIPEAIQQITRVLRQRHRLQGDQSDDFSIRNLADVASTAESAARMMGLLMAGIASISLLVGGIGVMNIMLVAVTERTREIGIRMALGAKSRHILSQFLLEAVLLSSVGGVLGVLLGIATAVLVSSLAGWPVLIPLGTMLIAVLFAAAVGVFFGLYPARKAANLDPIQALRYE